MTSAEQPVQYACAKIVSPWSIRPERPTKCCDMKVTFTRLDKELSPPEPAREGDAGFDLQSSIDFTLDPGERMAVPTGLATAFPVGHAALVLPRSGLAARHGIGLVNAPASSTRVSR